MMKVRISGPRRLAGAIAMCALTALPAVAAKQSLLVFPAGKPENIEQSVADTVVSALSAHADAGAMYITTTFYARSPLVVRAVNSGAITTDAMAGPFTAESASGIARAIGANAALIASVEDASVDEATNKASVTISVQIVSAMDGKALKTAGASAEAIQASTPAGALLRLAANNAAAKAAAQLFGTDGTNMNGSAVAPLPGKTPGGTAPAVAATATMHKSRSKKSGLLIGGLLLVAVIAAVSSGGGGSGNGGGGSGGPPPFPL